MAEATSSFLVVAPNEVDGLILKTLGEIGEFTESERCWFSTFDVRTSKNIDNFEWTAPGISPDMRQDPDTRFENYTWGMEEIRVAAIATALGRRACSRRFIGRLLRPP